jgi:6-phosphofructokinase 1
MKNIAVVTSGGDSPGMNAAVRAIVRIGSENDIGVYGVRRGYEGLIEDDMIQLDNRSVSGIIHQGGTFLGTARCEEFEESGEARQRCVDNLGGRSIEGLVVIGGNGSQAGACALKRLGFPVVGVASTVDNDLYGSDISIGVDTALDIALESIDRIRTTAESHNRAFLVEVMGRDYGYLALVAGITGGADVIVTPEFPMTPPEIVEGLRAAHQLGKNYSLAVVTDGVFSEGLGCLDYFRDSEDEFGFDVRVTILGHVQRGGAPNSADRLLATRFGAAAVELLASGESGQLVGWRDGRLAFTDLEEVMAGKKTLDQELWNLGNTLAR